MKEKGVTKLVSSNYAAELKVTTSWMVNTQAVKEMMGMETPMKQVVSERLVVI